MEIWLVKHWPAILSLCAAAGVVIGGWLKLRSGLRLGHQRISQELYKEVERLLDLKEMEIRENRTQIARLSGKLETLESLYAKAVRDLHEAQIENRNLRDQITRMEKRIKELETLQKP